MLFTTITRTDDAFKRALESEFGFLNRCSWPAAKKVRDFIELCIEQYPASERSELIARISSGDDRHFRSATFELFLHEYLRRQGFILTPHPTLQYNTTSKPDFLVECSDGSAFYLEAVSASSRNDSNPAGEARINSTLQHLENATHPDFFVGVASKGYPVSQPSGRRLTLEVLRWLETLDADSVIEISKNDLDNLPSMTWTHEDWTLSVTAIPCRPDARGKPRRLIGMRNGGASWIDGWTPIRDAVMDKGRKYGAAKLPLIVAVNIDTHRLNQIDEMQALFGQELIVFSRDSRNNTSRIERANNGAWIGPAGPRTRRCSGAWLFHDVSPYTLGTRANTLYINPWAYMPIPATILSVPHALVTEGYLHRIDGAQLGKVLELPAEWPND